MVIKTKCEFVTLTICVPIKSWYQGNLPGTLAGSTLVGIFFAIRPP